MSMPKGARYMPAMPMPMIYASRGSRRISPCICSISREPMLFSVAPTASNNIDLLTEWKIMSRMAAHTVSSTPMPAQATISPRLETVEKASTFLASFWAIAIMLAAMKVKPPMKATMAPVSVPYNAGERRMSR